MLAMAVLTGADLSMHVMTAFPSIPRLRQSMNVVRTDTWKQRTVPTAKSPHEEKHLVNVTDEMHERHSSPV